MQTHVSNKLFVSEDTASYGIDLTEELQPLLTAYDKRLDELVNALKEAHQSMNVNIAESRPQEERAVLLPLTLWNLFGKKESLWIQPWTKAGNKVPTKILVEAYFMWGKALRIAGKCGVDPAAAADAMAKAIHATVDKAAKKESDSASNEINDTRKYIFAAFMYAINRIASKQGIYITDQMDFIDWVGSRGFSDQGAFADILDCVIMYQEFLDSLDPGLPRTSANTRRIARRICSAGRDPTTTRSMSSLSRAAGARCTLCRSVPPRIAI
jgi:hypothetical protein